MRPDEARKCLVRLASAECRLLLNLHKCLYNSASYAHIPGVVEVNPVKINLVALGSAAVLTVYSAGFMRTKAAADRFANEDSERRQAVATTEHTPAPAPPLPKGVRVSAPSGVSVGSAEPRPSPKTPPAPRAAAHNPGAEAPLPKTPPPPSPLRRTEPTITKIADSAPLPQVVAPVPTMVNTPPSTPTSPVNSRTPADTPATAKERGPFKDGTYSGWGTSRHGDIQASVEIRDGHIASAWIAQCYTRYPCSRISQLIPQVAARQGPSVDYVSGATQSSNAFYYAIVEALSQAK